MTLEYYYLKTKQMNNMKNFFFSALLSVGVMLSSPAKADYTIYPVPQQATFSQEKVALGKKVNIVAEKGIDSYTIDRAKEVLSAENGIETMVSAKAVRGMSNLYLGVKGSNGVADKFAKKAGLDMTVFGRQGKFDRHVLSVRPAQKGGADIVILGEHTNAVFYGLASLEQMLEQAAGKEMQCAVINDYADMQYRGIVEGYYGYPYSFDVKKDLMKFFKKYKMNTYLYGAKSDPYHSGFWRDAYPETISDIQKKNGWLSQQMLRDLSALSLETKVNFIWAIHPNSGKSVDYHTAESTQNAVDDVMGKFDLMHGLGIRQFAVFLDDAGWDFDDVNNYRDFLTNLQTTLENKYNKNYTNPSDTVLPIHYVPHIYAINFAKKEDLKTYFDAISQTSSNIVVYTTGSGVWSSAKNEDFVIMEKLMKRPVALWWNYPCNDNKDGRIYTADMYSTLHEMGLPTPDKEVPQCLGMVSNPMQQGTVAKICLFGVADYSWNSAAFNTMANWEASFPAIIGKEVAPLYNYLAKYLRYQDTEDMRKMTEDYKAGNSDGKALTDTLKNIKAAADKMLALQTGRESDKLLSADLEPWLQKLSKMAETAITILGLKDMTDENKKWATYCELVKTLEDFKTDRKYMVDALEGMGENPPSELHRVEPSHKYLMPFIEWMEKNVYTFNTEDEAQVPYIIGNRMISSNGVKQADGTMYFETGRPAPVSDAITVVLPKAGTIENATVGAELLKNFNLTYSLYGKTFIPVKSSAELTGKQAKYIRIASKGKKAKDLLLTKENFSLKMAAAPEVESVTIPEGRVWDRHDAKQTTDGNYNTFTCLYRDQRDGDTYTVKLKKKQPVYDVTVALGTTNRDFAKVANVEVSADGQTWTALKVEGTDITDMRMSMPQIKKLNPDVSLCYFKGNGEEAQYVRFVLKESFQEKWLRLNEIEINAKYVAAQFVNTASANNAVATEAFDGMANTVFTPADGEPLVYNIISMNPTSQITVYAIGAGNAELTATNGTETVSLGIIKAGVNHIDMSKMPNVTSVTIKANKLSIAQIIKQ